MRKIKTIVRNKLAHLNKINMTQQATTTQISVQEFAKMVTDSVTNVLNTGGSLRINCYDGDFSYKALEFIEEFEENARAKNWTDQNKYGRFGTYLSNSAKEWYRLEMYKSRTPPGNWPDLKKAFIANFLTKDHII